MENQKITQHNENLYNEKQQNETNKFNLQIMNEDSLVRSASVE